jgi:hypothetical protein
MTHLGPGTWEATNELRWFTGPHSTSQPPVLQQKWVEVILYHVCEGDWPSELARVGKRATGNSEWRDVPLVVGDVAQREGSHS